jgi:nucleoid-associated protein YgaU
MKKSFIRRIEVQVGIILGVIMFSILGVFLGIRKGEKGQQEPVVVTKMEEASYVEDQKSPEQAQAEVQPPAEQVLAREGTAAQTVEPPPTQAAAVATPAVSAPTAGAATAPTEAPIVDKQIQVGVELPPSTVVASTLPTTHTVKANDTLIALARKYYGDDSKWTLIYEANRLSNQNSLTVGQKLTIPGPKGVKVDRQIVRVSNAKPKKASPGRAHRVQPGDTLYKLSRKYYGDESKWERIYNANEDLFSEKESLEPGDVLIIP